MLTTETQAKKHEDPRVIRTRNLLVDALAELIREKSFESITVSEIAQRATLNRATFYAHFQDKFALLEYSMRNLVRSQLQTELGAKPNLEEMLEKMLRVVCDFLENNEKHCPAPRGQMQTLAEKQIKDEIYILLSSRLLATKPNGHQPASAQQAAMIAAWAIYGAALQWSQQRKRQPMAEFVRQVLPLVKAGLAAYLPSEVSKPVGRQIAGRSPTSLLKYNLRLNHYFS